MRFQQGWFRLEREIGVILNLNKVIVALYCFMSCKLLQGNIAEVSPNFGHVHNHYPDEGETVQILFKTKLESSSDMITRDFHIVQLQLPKSSLVFDIHLHRNVELVHSSILGESPPHHAVYQGEFHPDGRVALTATIIGSENDCVGLSGHIIQGDNHFVLEPLPLNSSLRRRRSSETGNQTLLPHKLYNLETLVQHDNGSHADVLHVPREELEKAIEEMANSSSSSSLPTKATTENLETDDHDEKVDDDATDCTSHPSLTDTLASNSNRNKNNRKNQAKNNKPKSRGGNAPKMSTEGGKVVDIAVFADSKLSKVWEGRYPKEAASRLRGFILNLVNNMNLLYQQSSLGVALSFRLVHLEVMSGSPSGLDPSGGDAAKYLKSFCKYAGKKNDKGGQWDHALLLTGYDLQDEGDKLVAGMAWFSTMCLKYWSCSVSEGSSFATACILTHELGHSLGMEHDGSGVSKSCDANKFIMSPTTGSGKTSWSSCSSKNLKDFLNKGSPEVGKQDPAAIPTCLNRPSTLKSQQIRFSSANNKLPGEIYGLQVQCAYDCGDKCSPYIKNQEDVCAMLWCEKAVSGGKKISQAHPALEGSPCGSGKYCKYGKCVKSTGSG